LRFFAAPAWQGYILELLGTLAADTTDDKIDQFIRTNTGGGCHLVGTAAMTSGETNWGVVNPDLRVKGVMGLRVVDASVFVSSFQRNWFLGAIFKIL